MISLPGWFLVTVVSITYLPFTLQTDSLCTLHSTGGKHYSAWNFCFWMTFSNDTAGNGSVNCAASGGYMSYITANADFLSFISDNMDNHWRPGQDVFVGLRSWTENNLFTQWDSTPIYTFQWDYTNGQPDGIAQHEFCVVLSATGSHLWHNRDCTDSYPSLCYCELDSLTNDCSPPTNVSVTSTSLPSISPSFTTTTQETSPLSSDYSSPLFSDTSIFSTDPVTTGSASFSILTITSTVLVTSVLQYCPCSSTSNLTTNSTSNTTTFDINNLKIDKTSTSRYQRTKYSPGDTRPLSQFLGSSAIIIIVVFIGTIVAWDMTIIAQQIKIKYNQYKKGHLHKSAKVRHEEDIDL